MIEPNENSSIESTADIRIVGMNRDKTRKVIGPFARYIESSPEANTEFQVYFELSGTPPQAWRNIFEREWMAMTQPPLWQEASIDNRFLVMQCLLHDIAVMHLPVLKKVVTATNSAYHHYAQEQATKHGQRDETWTHERKAVDEMAESLHFE